MTISSKTVVNYGEVFHDKNRPKEFITGKPALQTILEEKSSFDENDNHIEEALRAGEYSRTAVKQTSIMKPQNTTKSNHQSTHIFFCSNSEY